MKKDCIRESLEKRFVAQADVSQHPQLKRAVHTPKRKVASKRSRAFTERLSPPHESIDAALADADFAQSSRSLKRLAKAKQNTRGGNVGLAKTEKKQQQVRRRPLLQAADTQSLSLR